MNDDREHLAYADENGEPEECIEDCPGCHWEGNADCEALKSGCDLCDPDGKHVQYATGGPVYDVGGFLRYGRIWISNDTGEDEEVLP